MGLARLSPATRTTVRVVGIALTAAGLIVLAVGAWSVMTLDAASGVKAAGEASMGIFAIAAGGMFLLFAGAVLLKFGFLKPFSEIVATETGAALEHSALRAGRGVSSGLQGSAGIRVRCRSCGFLESEDARFCSGCSQAM